MSIINKALKLKSQVDSMIEDKHRGEGALSQIMKQIKSDFGCSDLDAVEKKLKTMKKSLINTEQEIETEIENIEKELDEH